MSDALTGTWLIKMQTPMGVQEGTLVLADESGGLGGTLTISPMGDLALRDVAVEGSDLKWTVKGDSEIEGTRTTS